MDKISIYKNILFYNGIFYTEKKYIKTVSLHNRLTINFSPDDINSITDININNINIYYDKSIILLDGFHSCMGHLLWDFMYPSWYTLFYYNEKNCNNDFQWITTQNIDHSNGGWHLDILETFSGNPITTIKLFTEKYNRPMIIPWLVVGMNVGIGCVNMNLCIQRELKDHNNDPVEVFINRMYSRYNIKRNNILDIKNKNIIYIKNKREQYGIEELFKKLNENYKIYDFKIINFSDYNFKEQLNILNNTIIIITGVGTGRTNTPFLPNGTVEIQTNHFSLSNKNFIQYFDFHLGTLSKYIKILNIEYYTKEEAENKKISEKMEEYIEKSLTDLPFYFPINLEENIPPEINQLKDKIYNNPQKFNEWRNSGSNDILDLINIL